MRGQGKHATKNRYNNRPWLSTTQKAVAPCTPFPSFVSRKTIGGCLLVSPSRPSVFSGRRQRRLMLQADNTLAAEASSANL